MEQKELYLLITRHFNQQTVPWEEDFLAEWLESAEENRQTYRVLQEIWLASQQEHDGEQVALALEDVKQRIRNRRQEGLIKRYFWQAGVAAAIAGIVISSIFFLRQQPRQQEVAYIEKKTLPGQMLKDTLPDGTIVQLAPKSIIRYTQQFGQHDRNIVLEGQAFFEVAKDAHQPFTVKAGDLSVQVLGTRFNVTCYKGVDSAAVSLVDGKVQVNVPAQQQPYELQPGQELYYDSHDRHAYTRNYDVEAITGWTSRILVFRNEPLSVVANKLEQLYDVEISFASPAMAGYKLFARFNDKPLKYILDVIKATDNLDYTIDGKQIRFTTK
ncbi:FecR domain-containing protein [Chitinophaga filiformis]|uniref:FecR family protein n=1 Tax=Chitinophaga filiformis TaxID=104663 RepID=UPI001F237BDA|nr:FecR domain-containing protein [Chitinophaga filiformis]MCF6403775.1 FecR domain-containing protein [Chitinophaga filiformis]